MDACRLNAVVTVTETENQRVKTLKVLFGVPTVVVDVTLRTGQSSRALEAPQPVNADVQSLGDLTDAHDGLTIVNIRRAVTNTDRNCNYGVNGATSGGIEPGLAPSARRNCRRAPAG
jgi:hypothetical protein